MYSQYSHGHPIIKHMRYTNQHWDNLELNGLESHKICVRGFFVCEIKHLPDFFDFSFPVFTEF